MDLRERLAALAGWPAAATPVVSVYLDTRWTDEQQRERVRIFLKNELRAARAADGADRSAPDLDWVEAQGRALVEQRELAQAPGVAMFACHSAGLREIVPAREPFANLFVIEDTPFLRPLAAAIVRAPHALVVFVDGTSARLVPLDATGPGEAVELEADVEGRHKNGGWAALAQSRYQRHIEGHRQQYFEAVAEAMVALTEGDGVRYIVTAGEPRAVSLLKAHVPDHVAARIAGTVAYARHEPLAALLERAGALLRSVEAQAGDEAVNRVLDAAASGGQAVTGVDAAVDAVNRNAVRHLYLLETFQGPGRVCAGCGALQPGADPTCRFCGGETREAELGEAMTDRVVATGGDVTVVDRHPGLAREGGVGAALRYAA